MATLLFWEALPISYKILNAKVTDNVIIRQTDSTITINANAMDSIDIPVPNYDGYHYVSIIRVWAVNENCIIVNAYYKSTNTATVYVKNLSNAQVQNVAVYISFLYEK